MAQPRRNERTGPGRLLSLFATGTRPIPTQAIPIRKVGRYALYGEIASGGLATVHIGRLLGPVGFARTVAIKRLHPPFAKDPEFVAGFLDEARLAARIRHPNVVPTLDVVATGGELFVVMEFVLGESLAQLMRLTNDAASQVPIPVAVAIMVGVLHGLHAAHEARNERGEPMALVHRDVSPHNILVGADGTPHLIDFGVAKARGRSQVTRDGQIKGKLSYMPPEQLLGGAIDRRADIFAASIVLWETLTGRRLFQGVDDADVLARVLHAAVEPPSAHAPGLPHALDAVVLRGLARDKANRYSTAREMALALEAAAPLAAPSHIGNWVEALAHEALADRAARLAAVEQDASSGGQVERSSETASFLATASARSFASSSAEGANVAETQFAPLRRAHVRFAALLSAALVMLVLFAAIRWRGRPAVLGLVPQLASAPVRSTAIDRPDAPPLSATAVATPPKTDVPLGSARPVRNHRPSQQGAVTGRTETARPAPSIAPNRASCDPPFWYDAEGNKRYYRECVGL